MNYFTMFLLSIPGLFIATTVHEYTRAAISNALGDELPKNRGRLTLNPIKHFEPVGFLLLFYSGGFGWGKPVDTSSLRYKNRKKDTLMVAILPSVVNILVGMIALFIYTKVDLWNGIVGAIFNYTCYYSVGLAVYNLAPVSPMDCAKVLAVVLPSNKYYQFLQYEKMIQMMFLLLLFLGTFSGIFGTITNFVINLLGKILFIL